MPGPVLAVDAGERRLGLAISDPLRLLARPLAVLTRDHATGLAAVVDRLTAIVSEHAVAAVVVGLPLNADGSSGRQARRAERFASIIRRAVPVPVSTWDERLSTRQAEQILRDQGRSLKGPRSRGEIDALAAAVILQDYLDANRTSFAPTRHDHASTPEGQV